MPVSARIATATASAISPIMCFYMTEALPTRETGLTFDGDKMQPCRGPGGLSGSRPGPHSSRA